MSTTPSEIASLRVRLCTANEYGIWTGGAQAGKMEAVNATSLLGGVRFWTDALLRADGKHSCSRQERCNTSKGKPCPTCEIFGCTGLSRAFSLQVTPDANARIGFQKNILEEFPEYKHWDKRKNKYVIPKYFFTHAYRGNLNVRLFAIRPALRDGSYALPPEVLAALFLIAEYGTFGAYDQYGCGQVLMDRDENIDLRKKCSACSQHSGLPDESGVTLRDFFFFKGQLPESCKDTPRRAMGRIRYLVRDTLRKNLSDKFKSRHWFCGSLDKDQSPLDGEGKMANSGTNYAFSIGEDRQMYGWGHFARAGIHAEYIDHRETVINTMYDTFHDFFKNGLVWKEFDSTRDTTSPKDWPGYFASLISTQWRKNA